ncbi:hypothetical protein [Henriciella aquimarina]|uniref:hypothetical protein n=1 Tax=Henriciella aquimarina TaxID=545261 RepID=UPI0009FE4958|nr:hypothetical protein [Henriciella aquimarina]
MSFALIGLITAAASLLALLRSRAMMLGVLCSAALLQAASAMAFGSANITPGHLALGFFILAVLIRQGGLEYAYAAIQPLRPGFFLLALSVWGLMASFVMPRLFAGQFLVFPMNPDRKFIIEVPLFPSSANFNQAVYFLGGLLTFAFVSSLVRTNESMHKAAFALIIAAIVNLVIVAFDTISFAVGMSDMLNFLRNADYSQLFSHQYLGIKRVTGSFPEASSFAATTVGLFAFNYRLWRGGFRAELTGAVALFSFMALIFAFSSTGYVALLVFLAMSYARALTGGQGRLRPTRVTSANRTIFVALGPFLALTAAVIVAVRPDILDPITKTFDESITSKLGSASGMERMSWNMGGLNAFVQTFGIGAGLGSVRTSSFVVGVLANLGIVGAALFTAFFVQLFQGKMSKRSRLGDEDSKVIASAARSGCFATLLAAMVSASTVDLGLQFYIMAGMSCGALFFRPGRLVQAPPETAGDGPVEEGAPVGARDWAQPTGPRGFQA